MRITLAMLVLALSGATAACGGAKGGPVAPSSSSTTTTSSPTSPPQLAVFSDPASSFMTSDVRDVQEQIVRFDMKTNSLIWAADSRSFQGYPVDGNFIGADKKFEVRFGTKDGECRAYFTETASATICNVDVVGGQLLILPTSTPVPGSCH